MRNATALTTFAVAFIGLCWAAETDQIVFLHLKLKDDVVTLVDASLRPGRLKVSKSPQVTGNLQVELTESEGGTLWSDVIRDPTVQRLEYEDPATPGLLKSKLIKLGETEFTLRLPYYKAAKVLKVHRLDRPTGRVEAAAVGQSAKKLLGIIKLPDFGGVP